MFCKVLKPNRFSKLDAAHNFYQKRLKKRKRKKEKTFLVLIIGMQVTLTLFRPAMPFGNIKIYFRGSF